MFLLHLVWGGVTVYAQQNIFPVASPIVSPEVHANGTVTFRLRLPHVHQVYLQGDWVPKGTTPMKLHEGVWTYTSAELPPDLYIYTFQADGTTLIDPNNVYQIRDASSLYNLFMVPGKDSDDYRVKDVPHGTVSYRWYPSVSQQKQRRLCVYTPPGYGQSTDSNYPVLYLLHGMGGDEGAWMHLGRVSQLLDNLIAEKRMVPMIVVMSNGNISQQAAPGESPRGFEIPSFHLPRTMNGEFEASFTDIVSFVDQNYLTRPDKDGRAIAGLSMGGFHSLYISANYPDLFGYVGLFSPAIYPSKDVSSPLYQNLNRKLKAQADKGYKLYWIGIGTDDFLYKDVESFRKQLDALQVSYFYRETDKGHVWSNWRKYLMEFLSQAFR